MYSKIWIFDFDGTLVSSNKIKKKGFYSVIEETKESFSYMDEILDSSIKGRSNIFKLYEEKMNNFSLPVENYRLLTKKYSDLIDHSVACAPEITGAEALLNTLKRKKKIIMLSSATPEKNLKNIIENRKWSKYFDVISGMPKTKKKFIKEVIIAYNIKASNICVVGDGLDDRSSAEENGCNFLPVGNLNKLDSGYEIKNIINLIENRKNIL
ncbi:HAD hydrolase-like protein [Alphaproteobacteria bacterium]|nr:HAD hydrolase-like protein [Alphaproteobacteria bacterium]